MYASTCTSNMADTLPPPATAWLKNIRWDTQVRPFINDNITLSLTHHGRYSHPSFLFSTPFPLFIPFFPFIPSFSPYYLLSLSPFPQNSPQTQDQDKPWLPTQSVPWPLPSQLSAPRAPQTDYPVPNPIQYNPIRLPTHSRTHLNTSSLYKTPSMNSSVQKRSKKCQNMNARLQ